MVFIFLNFFEEICFGVLHQAVRAVSKNRPKYPMLDIPFWGNYGENTMHGLCLSRFLSRFITRVSEKIEFLYFISAKSKQTLY
jgi:hypothetical protein